MGHDPRPVEVAKQDVVVIGQQPDWHADLAVGPRGLGQVEELMSVLIAKDLELWPQPFERRPHGEPGPRAHVGHRRWTERREVAPHQHVFGE